MYFGKAKDVVGDLRSMPLVFIVLLLSLELISGGTGIPSLTEANRDKVTHQEMINSMKR